MKVEQKIKLLGRTTFIFFILTIVSALITLFCNSSGSLRVTFVFGLLGGVTFVCWMIFGEDYDNDRAELWRQHVRKLISDKKVGDVRELFLNFLVKNYRIDEWDLRTLRVFFASSSLLTSGIPLWAFRGLLALVETDSYKREPDIERMLKAVESHMGGVLEQRFDEKYKENVWDINERIFRRFVATLEIPEEFTKESLNTLGYEHESFRPKLKQVQATA